MITGKLLLISSPKGGVGKTLTARACAVSAALEGRRVLLVDLDRQRSIKKWYSRRPDSGVASFDYADGDWDAVQEIIDAIPDYDLIVVDTPTAVEDYLQPVKTLILASDFILVPTGDSDDDLDSTVPWMRVIRSLTSRSAFILNRINRQTRSVREAKMRLLKEAKLCPVDLPVLEDIKTAIRGGVMAHEVSGMRGGQELGLVWDYVRNELS